MAWTPWRKVADKLFWYADHCLRIPVCYQLAVADPHDLEEPEVVYVGAAASEHEELAAFDAGEKGALSARAREVTRTGKAIYYRARGAPTLTEAEALRDACLKERAYPWVE